MLEIVVLIGDHPKIYSHVTYYYYYYPFRFSCHIYDNEHHVPTKYKMYLCIIRMRENVQNVYWLDLSIKEGNLFVTLRSPKSPLASFALGIVRKKALNG
jgi:hypothetical protein